MVKNHGTHITHCCRIHGCKYGNTNCPVETKTHMQKYVCEQCSDALEEMDEMILYYAEVVALKDSLYFYMEER